MTVDTEAQPTQQDGLLSPLSPPHRPVGGVAGWDTPGPEVLARHVCECTGRQDRNPGPGGEWGGAEGRGHTVLL